MANEILKDLFQEVHSKIVFTVNPASVMDALFSKKVISFDDYDGLRHVTVPMERCRDLLSLLHRSSHPQAFIHLRLALVDLKEYWWIVDEIDKKLPSLTFQLQQLHLGNSTDEENAMILPKSSKKNQLQDALENQRFEDASRLIASSSEADLMECFESPEGSIRSCLHVIAAISDIRQASKLCRKLLDKAENTMNRECFLNMRTVEEFRVGRGKVRARVAAIHIAAYSGNSEVVRLLCQEYGVDGNCNTSETIEEQPRKGMTPLEWAARKGHVAVVRVLIDNKADVNVSRPSDGSTPLCIAAHYGHTEVVNVLLSNKANVNACRHNGATPLCIAAEEGHSELVKLLLANKANVGSNTDTGLTPLWIAAWNGHTEVVKLLIHNKANVNASKDNGVTPLWVAAQERHVEVMKLLLANKANVNACQHDGVTPLHIAAQQGHTDVVKLLLANKANVNARRADGDKAIDIARRNNYLDIIKLLS